MQTNVISGTAPLLKKVLLIIRKYKAEHVMYHLTSECMQAEYISSSRVILIRRVKWHLIQKLLLKYIFWKVYFFIKTKMIFRTFRDFYWMFTGLAGFLNKIFTFE